MLRLSDIDITTGENLEEEAYLRFNGKFWEFVENFVILK